SAMLSILGQQGLNFELIVVDDGSDDRTYDILSLLAAEHANMRLVRNPKAGKCSAFNYGVSCATGRFTCIYAGDDLMPEGSLAARFSKVSEFPESDAVVGLCKLITLSDDKKFDGHLVPKRAGQGGL